MRSPLLLLTLLAACHSMPDAKQAACTPGFQKAVAMMCDVDRLGAISADAPLGAGLERTAWITEHVADPDAIELRTLMSVKDAATQAKMLRASARDAGVPQCALADSLERTGAGGLAP